MTSAADELTIALVLVAALLHASWNALAKASGDATRSAPPVRRNSCASTQTARTLSVWPTADSDRMSFSSALTLDDVFT